MLNCLMPLLPFCLDTNECLNENGSCSQICTNTLGSYNCSCRSGYILLEDKASCTGNYGISY